MNQKKTPKTNSILFKDRDIDHIKGKLSFRLRKQLELEGSKEVIEYKKDKNDPSKI